jgi:tRNA (guanine-N7-)-methyltransferase
MTDADRPHRPIRSFVRREGRLTPGQQRAFARCWPRWGIDIAGAPLDLPAVYGNTHPCYLEIGFGNGESLIDMALRQPPNNYLGIEVHGPGVGHLLLRIEEEVCSNVRVIQHDAVEVMEQMLPDGAFAGVYLFFPDPWHKKRHHKRRILQPRLLDNLARIIAPGGVFHAATDWQDYAAHMMTVLSDDAARFDNTAGTGSFALRPDWRLTTKFEHRGRRLGHGVWDLIFRRRP